MAHRPRVRRVAVATLTLMLSGPLVTACGFNVATNRVYTPAMGANERELSVDVLGAVIVAAEDGAGNFIATLSNNSANQPASLVTIASTGEPAAQVQGSLDIPARTAINLADDGGLPTTGEFEVGQFVPLTFTFSTDEGTESIEVDVPVVPDTEEFEGLGSTPEDTSSDTASDPAIDPASDPASEAAEETP